MSGRAERDGAESFAGFRAGSRATVIPNSFFTAVLPAIGEPAELIVSCYIFFALARRRGFPRAVSAQALAGEPPLMRALARFPDGPLSALREGLALAVAHGTLLVAPRRAEDGGGEVYILNTEHARRLLAENGALALAEEPLPEREAAPPPSIYALYEENIGSIPPLLVDELSDAEESYPKSWLEAAFREAVARNRRNWRYISRILERWKIEGPDYEATGGTTALGPGTRRRSLAGPYRHLVRRAPNG